MLNNRRNPERDRQGLSILSLQLFCNLKLFPNKTFIFEKTIYMWLDQSKKMYVTTKKYNNAKERHRLRPWAFCHWIFDFGFKFGNDLQAREKKHSSFQRLKSLSHLLALFFLTTSSDQDLLILAPQHLRSTASVRHLL